MKFVYLLCEDKTDPEHDQDRFTPLEYFASTKILGAYGSLKKANEKALDYVTHNWWLDEDEFDKLPEDFSVKYSEYNSQCGYFYNGPLESDENRETYVYVVKKKFEM